MPPITAADVVMFLLILIGVMVVVVLYHMLFIVVDVRRVMKRVDRVTVQVEEFILKPVAIMDQVITSLFDLFDSGKKKPAKHGFDHRSVK